MSLQEEVAAKVAEGAACVLAIGERFGSIGLAARGFLADSIPALLIDIETLRAEKAAIVAEIEALVLGFEDEGQRAAELASALEQIAEYPPG